MATRLQTAALEQLAIEATALAGQVRRYREQQSGRSWAETRGDALTSLAAFHRRLSAIDLRRAEMVAGL